MLVAIVRGSGDVASAVAHRLFVAGHGVVVQDSTEPTATRRGMAFADAIFAGSAELAGVTARRVDDPTALVEIVATRRFVPVVAAELPVVLALVAPAVLIDARMRKRSQPEPQRHLAPLTIGLGPNFIAGETTDIAVETAWGDDLGRVLTEGATRPLAGEPRPIAGHGRDRYVYAPTAGVFRTTLPIGAAVTAGDVIARISDTPVVAPLTGVVRGLTHDGVTVEAGTKIIEVDPRGAAAVVTGLGERPARIADGVLAAIERWAERNVAQRTERADEYGLE